MSAPASGRLAGGASPAACHHEEGCITCSDAAISVRVLALGEEPGQALCEDGEGRRSEVAAELVGEVAPGDVLLVHAGVAIARVDGAEGGSR